jgi:hypothetical protein
VTLEITYFFIFMSLHVLHLCHNLCQSGLVHLVKCTVKYSSFFGHPLCGKECSLIVKVCTKFKFVFLGNQQCLMYEILLQELQYVSKT